MRQTKIMATLGPATDSAAAIAELIDAGVNLVRLNFSHGSAQAHQARAAQIRSLASEARRPIGILVDLQGPKIRIGAFENGAVTLSAGQAFRLDLTCPAQAGDATRVYIDFPNITQDVTAGDLLLLDDGRIALEVNDVTATHIDCVVQTGGVLSDHKGLNKKGGGLSAASLTDKDRQDIETAVALQADYIAVSFVKSAADIEQARRYVGKDKAIGIIAKIECAEAVNALDAIIQASDAVMVARGDLGVEMGDAEIPALQQRIITEARKYKKAVIVATQMMESMVSESVPTRAEVADVAHAVLQRADCLMLSAETAVGAHPSRVVEAMSRVCLSAEKDVTHATFSMHIESTFQRIDESIAYAAMFAANHLHVAAILCLTETGTTPRWMSRVRTNLPIYALSRQADTITRMTLYRSVHPVAFNVLDVDERQVNQAAVDTLKATGALQVGDTVIITRGDLIGVRGQTNSLKILTVQGD